MKSVTSICKSILVTAVFLLALSAWAENKGSLQLQHPTNVAGKTLATGDYVVRWEGKGDQVELKIYKGKNVVASIPARVIQLSSPADYNSAVVSTGGDGSASLSEIRFSGKKMALQVGAEGGSAGSAGAAR